MGGLCKEAAMDGLCKKAALDGLCVQWRCNGWVVCPVEVEEGVLLVVLAAMHPPAARRCSGSPRSAMLASFGGHLGIVQQLAAAGADLRAADRGGWSG